MKSLNLKTLFSSGGLLLAGALMLAACGESRGDATALTVNGEEISLDELIGDVEPDSGEGRGTVDLDSVAAAAQERIVAASGGDPTGAQVTVSPEIGSWDPETCSVVPPSDIRDSAGEALAPLDACGPAAVPVPVEGGGAGNPLQPELASIVPFDETAVTVDGVEISGTDLFNEVEQQAIAAEVGGQPAGVRTDDGFVSDVVAEVATNEVVAQLARSESDRRGLQVTDEARDEIAAGLGEIPPGLSDEFIDSIIERQAMFQVLVNDLAGTDRPSANLTIDDVVCARHILVETAAEADGAISRIDGGEDFAAVAAELSTDGSAAQGGALGCADPGLYVPEFADALVALEPGDMSGAVESQFGFHVIERLEADPAEAQAALETQRLELAAAEEQSAFQEWVQIAVSESVIDVDPRIGTWDPLGGVVPAN